MENQWMKWLVSELNFVHNCIILFNFGGVINSSFYHFSFLGRKTEICNNIFKKSSFVTIIFRICFIQWAS